MHILSACDTTQAEHYTKQTLVKLWLSLMLYSNIILGIFRHVSRSDPKSKSKTKSQ